MKPLVSTSLFVLRYSPKLVNPPVAHRYLEAPNHPLRPKIAHMYAHRDTNTLWWRVAKQKLQPFKGVVRSWCARRTRIAFRQALAARGFDREGRKIQSHAQDGVATAAAAPGLERGLTGSVEIVVLPPCMKEKFSTVQEQTASMLDTLIQEVAKSSKRVYSDRSSPRNHGRNANWQ